MPESVTFIDTNILAYAYDPFERRKQELAEALLLELWQQRSGALSTQVLREFYMVATRKFEPRMSRSGAREVVGLYSEWPIVKEDVSLLLGASLLEERHQMSFWDALIVEAARRSGAQRLVSEDLQSGRRIGGVMIENPFV